MENYCHDIQAMGHESGGYEITSHSPLFVFAAIEIYTQFF